jgi:alpha-tubulin suppressor-like RCC1 family protein
VTNAVSLALGAATSCAVIDDGTMKCWGDNDRGQNANGTAVGIGFPGLKHFNPVPVVTGVTNIAAAGQGFPACALKLDGTVSCWGDFDPIIGTHTTTKETPVAQLGNDNAFITAGGNSTCVLKNDGRLFCRGANSLGQLGNGSGLDSLVVFQQVSTSVLGNTRIKPDVIAVGQYHSCAIKPDGNVACWGANAQGQLGDGTTTSSNQAVHVAIPEGAQAIAAGGAHTCVLTKLGTVACWGDNSAGQLGTGITNGVLIDSLVPKAAANPLNYRYLAIAAAANQTCAVVTNGDVACWGQGNLGGGISGTNSNSNTTQATAPFITALVPGGAKSISIGLNLINPSLGATCVVTNLAGVSCWGFNAEGQLGDGSVLNRVNPVSTTLVGAAKTISLSDQTSCAVLSNGKSVCWGSGAFGQVGNGQLTPQTIPTNVSITGNSFAIAAGRYFTCGLKDAGIAECWGTGTNGQLGNGVLANTTLPSPVTGITTATVIGAGSQHACVLLANAEIYCWGGGAQGQLGNGQSVASSTPVKVLGFTGVVATPMAFWK